MTAEEKLQWLYEHKNELSPLTQILVIGFAETQKGEMKEHDKMFIEEIFPLEKAKAEGGR